MLWPILMILAAVCLRLNFASTVMATVMLAASFGPVLALANLSAAMDSTLASGERVLSLLEEEPVTPDVTKGARPDFSGASVRHLTFS